MKLKVIQKQTIPSKTKQSSEWWTIVLLNLNAFEFLTCDELRKERTATITWKLCWNTGYSELELTDFSMKLSVIDWRVLKQLLDTAMLGFQNYTIASLEVFNKTKRQGTSREYLVLPLAKEYCKGLPPQCDPISHPSYNGFIGISALALHSLAF